MDVWLIVSYIVLFAVACLLGYGYLIACAHMRASLIIADSAPIEERGRYMAARPYSACALRAKLDSSVHLTTSFLVYAIPFVAAAVLRQHEAPWGAYVLPTIYFVAAIVSRKVERWNGPLLEDISRSVRDAIKISELLNKISFREELPVMYKNQDEEALEENAWWSLFCIRVRALEVRTPAACFLLAFLALAVVPWLLGFSIV